VLKAAWLSDPTIFPSLLHLTLIVICGKKCSRLFPNAIPMGRPLQTAPAAPKQTLALDLLPFAQAVQTKPAVLPFPCSDPSDDKFLLCALQGQANALISGDKGVVGLGWEVFV
jgi:hypothetical protein